MNNRTAVMGSIAVSLGLIVWWMRQAPSVELTLQEPGLDGAPAEMAQVSDTVIIGSEFISYEPQPVDLDGIWPRFRGIRSDNRIYDPQLNLKSVLLRSQPPELWRLELGEGHSAPAIYKGLVYLLDYDEKEKADALRCFSLAAGKEVWRRWYRVPMKRNHGYSRTVPAVTEDYILTIGPQCHVMCVDRLTGDLRWGIDMPRVYGTKVPMWYTGQCPLIDDTVAVLAPGGSALLTGIDCATGKEIWRTPNSKGWNMSHASMIPMAFEGRKMYVYTALEGMVGVAADGPERGTVLWETSEWRHSVIAPSPVRINGNRIFVAAGYGAGGGVIEIFGDGSTFSAQLVQKVKPAEGLNSEQQTPVYHKGKIYAVLAKDAGPMRNRFVCVDPTDVTKYLWDSGKTRRFGLGPYLLLNNHFLVVSDDGSLTVIKAGGNAYEEKAHYKIMDGKDTWGPLAYADGRLLMRDDKYLVCLGLKKHLPL